MNEYIKINDNFKQQNLLFTPFSLKNENDIIFKEGNVYDFFDYVKFDKSNNNISNDNNFIICSIIGYDNIFNLSRYTSEYSLQNRRTYVFIK